MRLVLRNQIYLRPSADCVIGYKRLERTDCAPAIAKLPVKIRDSNSKAVEEIGNKGLTFDERWSILRTMMTALVIKTNKIRRK